MPRLGRPRTVERPPCPACEREDRVVSHGFETSGGERFRVFRCERCGKRFAPGRERRRADPAIRWAVRRVRQETGVNYRLLASALTNHLGLGVTHATVGAWCRAPFEGSEPEGTPCEYLSLLWALKQEIEAGFASTGEDGRSRG